MATLNFSLPDDLKRWIEAQVAAGGYGNTSEYIRELIRLDRKRKVQEKLESLLLEGLDSGAPIEITPEFWEKKREELMARLREKQKTREEARHAARGRRGPRRAGTLHRR